MAATNDRGHIVGQDHWRSRLTDREVEMLRDLHEEGWGYTRLARAFNISKGAARNIVLCRSRAQTIAGFKMILIKTEV